MEKQKVLPERKGFTSFTWIEISSETAGCVDVAAENGMAESRPVPAPAATFFLRLEATTNIGLPKAGNPTFIRRAVS